MAGFGASYDKFARSGRAVTVTLIALMALTYVLRWVTLKPMFYDGLAIVGLDHPWAFLTYPFAATMFGPQFIWFVLLLFWLFWVGTDLERTLGAFTFALLFFASTVIGAISILLWSVLFQHVATEGGPLIPIGAVTVAWGIRNATTCIRLWCVIPITGKWIAVLEAGIVLFSEGEGAPIRGVFALIPLAVAWAYAANRLPGLNFGPVGSTVRDSRALKARERNNQAYFSDVRKREKERADKERLRKLLEGSVSDEDK